MRCTTKRKAPGTTRSSLPTLQRLRKMTIPGIFAPRPPFLQVTRFACTRLYGDDIVRCKQPSKRRQVESALSSTTLVKNIAADRGFPFPFVNSTAARASLPLHQSPIALCPFSNEGQTLFSLSLSCSHCVLQSCLLNYLTCLCSFSFSFLVSYCHAKWSGEILNKDFAAQPSRIYVPNGYITSL